MLAAIFMVGSGATLVIFMNSSWDDSKVLTYIDLDSDTDPDTHHYSHDSISATNAL